MKQQYGWISEYKRKKFLEKRNTKDNIPHNFIRIKSSTKIPKSIAIMLDLDGTTNFINDEKAEIFINQISKIKKKFNAKLATISISTHYSDNKKIKEVLDILSKHLKNNIKIGLNFFYGGTYDYTNDLTSLKEEDFNMDKISTFIKFYVDNINMNNQWFALIDDNIEEKAYKKYKQKYPLLICRPSQSNINLKEQNFMNISTKTPGFDGVIESLEKYITSIKYMAPSEVISYQTKINNNHSKNFILEKLLLNDYEFIEQYIKEQAQITNDFSDILNTIEEFLNSGTPYNKDLTSLKDITKLKNLINLIKEYSKTTPKEKTKTLK